MGIIASRLWARLFGSEERKILIVGLDQAGKTTVLYRLLLNQTVQTAPTIGSNVEEVVYKNIRFLMWDVGGQTSIRATWATYYINTRAVIMVIDSTDIGRLHLARTALHEMMGHESLKDSILLVFANKQDLREAQTAAQISQALELTRLTGRSWHIQSCSALTGSGLFEGLDWIVNQLQETK